MARWAAHRPEAGPLEPAHAAKREAHVSATKPFSATKAAGKARLAGMEGGASKGDTKPGEEGAWGERFVRGFDLNLIP